MLSAQVEYWKLQETGRHNLVAESQGWANLNLGYKNLEETTRHNTQQEGIGWFSTKETQRHNVAQENLGWANLSELSRSNRANESIGWANAMTNQANAATNYGRLQLDTDLGYLNRDIQDRLATVQEHNADTNAENARLRGKELELAKDKAAHDMDYDWTSLRANVNRDWVNGLSGMVGNLFKGGFATSLY